jgi:protocatechuate 3,4-dioxygenase beta subunit
MKQPLLLSVTLCATMLAANATLAAPKIVFPYEERMQQQQQQPAGEGEAITPPPAPYHEGELLAVPSAQLPVADEEKPDDAVLSAPLPSAGDRYAKACTPTPAHGRQAYPGKGMIPTSNKLARPAGKSIYAEGTRLYLTGRVFDAACVPLREAKVEIWQADYKGTVRYARPWTLSNPYPTFAGAGQVETDNRGEYLFETVMPAGVAGQTPLINIRVMHPSMRAPLVTTLYFAGESANVTDKVYQQLSDATRAAVTSPLIPFELPDAGGQAVRVHHDVTVQARDGFRSF